MLWVKLEKRIALSKAKREASSEVREREREREVGLVREALSEASCFM